MSAHENGESVMMPPNDRTAERALLGSILREPVIIEECLGTVRADDFYIDAHTRIFTAMASIADKGKAIDTVTIAEWLAKKKWIDDVSVNYLADLWEAAPSAANWRQYCEIIRDRSTRRKLISTGAEISEAAFSLANESSEIVASADRTISEITERGIVGETVELRAALGETYTRIDARRERGGDLSGVPTGFNDLDSLLCGFQNSELIIIGARPSIGKTAFALNVIRHAAMNCQIPTLFVSLEQARTEIAERLLCMEGRIDSHKLRRGYLSATDQTDIVDAGDRLGRAPLFIADAPIQTVSQLTANARRMKRKHNIGFVVIDYLQMIDPEDRRANRQEQVAASSRRLKGLARDLKIPVVVVCAVNRGPEDRTDKKPRLSDLRESGAIEFDADTVILLHREEDSGSQALIDVIVAKQRSGPTGEAKLVFQKAYMKFFDGATL